MSVYLSAIGCANPKNKYSQHELVEFMAEFHALNEDEKRKLTALYRASGIKTRYSVLPDFRMNGRYDLFKIKEPDRSEPGTSNRMENFRGEALKLACNAIDECHEDIASTGITHIITVSCTGLYAPGLDYDIIRHYSLDNNIERYGINFMGCFAAINALKAGYNFCKANQKAKVLIVCVELCSIHLQNDPTEDNLLANALFGDGASAVILSNEPPETSKSITLQSFHSAIIPQGETDMAWNITDFGFQMRLSQYVPDIIKDGMHNLTDGLFSKIGKKDFSYFLVHPGGKKILQTVEEHIGMTKEMNHYAYKVLRDYGNMSSPTILFVLKLFMDNLQSTKTGENILALAFGPGLTLESAILKIQ